MTDRGRERPKLALVPPADETAEDVGEQPFDLHASRQRVARRLIVGVIGPALLRRGFTHAEIAEALEGEACTWRQLAAHADEAEATESEDGDDG